MDRRSFLNNLVKSFAFGAASIHTLKSILISASFVSPQDESGCEKSPNELLKEIYKEVLELGPHGKDDVIIKREFHINIDKNEENKEEHIVVMSYKEGDKQRMIIQVTYFEPKRKNSVVKYPKEIRNLKCDIQGDVLKIRDCDYNNKEIKVLLPEILQGIQKNKKMLKLIEHKY